MKTLMKSIGPTGFEPAFSCPPGVLTPTLCHVHQSSSGFSLHPKQYLAYATENPSASSPVFGGHVTLPTSQRGFVGDVRDRTSVYNEEQASSPTLRRWGSGEQVCFFQR